MRRRFSIIEPLARLWERQRLPVKIVLLLALAVFVVLYPRTLSAYWQEVLFYPVGIFILLGLGLNVVVGSAGLEAVKHLL